MPRVALREAEIGVYAFNADSRSPIANIEFDLNAFRDPLGNLTLRKQCSDGIDAAVQQWIKVDPRFAPLLNQCIILVKDHFHDGHSKWFSIAFRDYHGKWISHAVATLIADELSGLGYKVGVMYSPGQD